MKIKMGSIMLVLVIGLVAGLVLTVAIPASAAGSADKVTGSGTFINQGGNQRIVDFNAHESRDGKPAKGTYVDEDLGDPGTFTADLDEVEVYDDGTRQWACFGGYIIEGTGRFEDSVGKYRWTTAVDGGEGADAEDYLRGGIFATKIPQPDFCTNGNTGNSEAFSGGNVQIHVGRSYE